MARSVTPRADGVGTAISCLTEAPVRKKAEILWLGRATRAQEGAEQRVGDARENAAIGLGVGTDAPRLRFS